MPKKEKTFEESLARLEEILRILESGETELDGLLKLYEEGVRLVAFCNKTLSSAKQKITELSQLPAEELADE